MGNITPQTGLHMLERWTSGQLKLKESNPMHKVGVPVSAEIRLPGGTGATGSIRNMAGGLGILQYDTVTADANPLMQLEDFRLFHTSLAHTLGRGIQSIGSHYEQLMSPSPWGIERNEQFLPLGVIFNANMGGGEKEPVYGYLYRDLMENRADTPVVLFQTLRPGITDVFYPPNGSPDCLRSQIVLGEGTFQLAKILGIFDPAKSNPLGTAIINDCHGALIASEILKDHLLDGKDWETALTATRRQCVTTIHAPQPGTVNRFGPNILRMFYDREEINMLYRLGMDHEDSHAFNTLNLALVLSGGFSCVSPGHFEITMDRENNLVPSHILDRVAEGTKLAAITSNIVSPLVWLSPHRQELLEKFIPGVLTNPDVWIGPEKNKGWNLELFGNLMMNQEFKKGLIKSREADRKTLLEFLSEERDITVPDNAIIFGAMRRATAYKLNQLNDLLENEYENLVGISEKHGPAFLLFGGIAPDTDYESLAALERLLKNIKKINNANNGLRAAFVENYNEYMSHIILNGVDIWGMFSDATTPNVQLKEAFGPSGGKALNAGALCIGGSDGWAPHFNDGARATTIFGPVTNVHGNDVGRNLRSITDHQMIKLGIRQVTADSFAKSFGDLCIIAREERNLIGIGLGHLSWSLNMRLAAMRSGLYNFHPVQLLRALERLSQDVSALTGEVCSR